MRSTQACEREECREGRLCPLHEVQALFDLIGCNLCFALFEKGSCVDVPEIPRIHFTMKC